MNQFKKLETMILSMGIDKPTIDFIKDSLEMNVNQTINQEELSKRIAEELEKKKKKPPVMMAKEWGRDNE